MKKEILLALLCSTATLSFAEALRFASVLTDHAVIQRNVAAPIWGKADAGKSVTLKLNGKTVATATADENGKWLARLPVQKANAKPSVITAECGNETVSISDILFGDVWFGSGQSNMGLKFSDFNWRVAGGKEYVKTAGNPLIRTLTFDQVPLSGLPETEAPGVRWRVADPADPWSIENFSAVLFHFGDQLQSKIKIPVGLVNSSFFNTKAESWMDPFYSAKHGKGRANNVANWYLERYKRWIGGEKDTYEQRAYEWNKRFAPGDNFTEGAPFFKKGSLTFHDLDFDDSWMTQFTVTTNGFTVDPWPENFSGSVWLRTTFELTQDEINNCQSILFDKSYGTDHTWINGVCLGGSGSPWHGYGMKREALRVGKNVIAIPYKAYAAKDNRGGVGFCKAPVLNFKNRAPMVLDSWKAAIPGEIPTWRDPRPEYIPGVNSFSMFAMHLSRIRPLYPMAIKGAIWYQGCSNLWDGQYPNYVEAIIGGWRENFTYDGKLPVILTELAPSGSDQENPEKCDRSKPVDGSGQAGTRAQLMQLSNDLPDCGTVCLLDLGESDIHPARKKEVAERYLRMAANLAYGSKTTPGGPVCTSVDWNGKTATLHFKNAKGLKIRDGRELLGFEVAGKPSRHPKGWNIYVHHFAKAKIVGDTVIVTAPEVDDIYSVRYAYIDQPKDYNNPSEWNLTNETGIPCGTIRFERPETPKKP